jgi:hypothetical protein
MRELREGPRRVCVEFVWRHIGAVACVSLRFVRIRSCIATVGAIRSQIWETGRWVGGRDVMSFSFIYRCTWKGKEGPGCPLKLGFDAAARIGVSYDRGDGKGRGI